MFAGFSGTALGLLLFSFLTLLLRRTLELLTGAVFYSTLLQQYFYTSGKTSQWLLLSGHLREEIISKIICFE